MAADDTAPGPLDHHKRSRIKWDPTINLGHVLTFAGFVFVGATGYFDLRQRQAVQEVRVSAVEGELRDSGKRIQDTMRDLRDDVKEVRRGVEDLNRTKKP